MHAVPQLHVDNARPGDGAAMAALWRAHLAALGEATPPHLEDLVEAFIAQPAGGLVLVVRVDGEVRGAALVSRTPAVLRPGQQWVVEVLASEAGQRGSGVGAALLRHVQERARLEGIARVLSTVSADASGPSHDRRVLEAHGFTEQPVRLMAWAPAPPDPAELHDALVAGNTVRTQGLLARGADPDAADLLGRPPLHVACAQGDVAAVSSLLRAGANRNARDGDGRTPLMVAVALNHETCVQQLLDAGADVTPRNRAGRTALDFVGETVASPRENVVANRIHALLLSRGGTR